LLLWRRLRRRLRLLRRRLPLTRPLRWPFLLLLFALWRLRDRETRLRRCGLDWSNDQSRQDGPSDEPLFCVRHQFITLCGRIPLEKCREKMSQLRHAMCATIVR